MPRLSRRARRTLFAVVLLVLFVIASCTTATATPTTIPTEVVEAQPTSELNDTVMNVAHDATSPILVTLAVICPILLLIVVAMVRGQQRSHRRR